MNPPNEDEEKAEDDEDASLEIDLDEPYNIFDVSIYVSLLEFDE